MRLLTDPQPAIEWLCTGGSVCIGLEETLRDDSRPEPRPQTATRPKRQERFPAGRSDA